ncbi:MAG: cell wall hydrolase [Eubacteriales bacterium]|nr:cell wall hydrolase [Eubacteriales bacterium]
MKNHHRDFNSKQPATRSKNDILIHREPATPINMTADAQPMNEEDFFSAFESYPSRSYEDLIRSEASDSSLDVPQRISTLDQQKPFRMARVIRYLSAASAFIVLSTTILAFKPFNSGRSWEAASDVRGEAVLSLPSVELASSQAVRLLNRSQNRLRSVRKPKKSPGVDNYLKSNLIAIQAPSASSSTRGRVVPQYAAPVASASATSVLESQEATIPTVPVQAQEPEGTAPASSDINPTVNLNTMVSSTTTVESVAEQEPAQEPTVPETQPTSSATAPSKTKPSQSTQKKEEASAPAVGNHSSEEVEDFYHLIAAEAAPGWSYEGQMLIASVVMNRLHMGSYGSTLTSVIYAPGQFSPVGNGSFKNRIANDLQRQVVNDALRGEGLNLPSYVIGFCTNECFERPEFKNRYRRYRVFANVTFFFLPEHALAAGVDPDSVDLDKKSQGTTTTTTTTTAGNNENNNNQKPDPQNGDAQNGNGQNVNANEGTTGYIEPTSPPNIAPPNTGAPIEPGSEIAAP